MYNIIYSHTKILLQPEKILKNKKLIKKWIKKLFQ